MEQGKQVLHSKEGQSGTTRLARTSVRSRVKVQMEATAQMSEDHNSSAHQQSDLRSRFICLSGHRDLLNNLEGRLQMGIFKVLGILRQDAMGLWSWFLFLSQLHSSLCKPFSEDIPVSNTPHVSSWPSCA